MPLLNEKEKDLSGTTESMTETGASSKNFALSGVSALDANDASDLYLEEGGKGAQGHTENGERVPIMRRRIFRNGCLLIPFIIGTSILALLTLICIFFPTTYMGIGPHIAKSAVDHTNLQTHNIRITSWAFTQANSTDTCAQYFPQSLTVIQDLLFTDIPWYAQMGNSYIEPSGMDLYYNGTKFAVLYLPKLDLSNPSNNQKWANDTVTTMIVTNTQGFLDANANLLPLGTLTLGWAMWQQSGSIILQTELLGITSYYPADMNKNVNISDVQFLAGPMANIQDNVWDALLCTGGAMMS